MSNLRCGSAQLVSATWTLTTPRTHAYRANAGPTKLDDDSEKDASPKALAFQRTPNRRRTFARQLQVRTAWKKQPPTLCTTPSELKEAAVRQAQALQDPGPRRLPRHHRRRELEPRQPHDETPRLTRRPGHRKEAEMPLRIPREARSENAQRP